MALRRLHHDCEERVERRDHVAWRVVGGEGRGADQVDEQHSGSTLLAAECAPLLECASRHVLSHVATEQVAQALALAQARHHAVECGLEEADLARVIDGDLCFEAARLNLGERPPQRPERIGDRLYEEDHGTEADHQRGDTEEEHRHRHAVRGDGKFERDRRDRDDPEHGDGGPQRPREQRSNRDARHRIVARWRPLERAAHHRPPEALR